MTWGTRQQKRNKKGIGNSGKFSRTPVGDKPTKKANLKYLCQSCGNAHLRKGWRAGRLEFQE